MTQQTSFSFTVGYRTIMGTHHPVMNIVNRDGPGRWRATYSICNGIAQGSDVFRTKKAAIAACDWSLSQ